MTASTGLEVNCDIAIADELIIGEITCKNVVFLVLNDEDLSFPQIDYYPNGAIGFPVIEALDEIRIDKDNNIFVPQNPVEYTFNNFALDGLMPIIACEYEGDTLSFHFDTGATSTSLYSQFYKDYKEEIEISSLPAIGNFSQPHPPTVPGFLGSSGFSSGGVGGFGAGGLGLGLALGERGSYFMSGSEVSSAVSSTFKR